MATIKIGSGTQTFSANKADIRYEMADGAAITTGNFGIEATGAARNREIVINGDVNATLAAVRLGSNDGSAASVTFTVGKAGSLVSTNTALLSYAEGNLIRNAGEISGGTSGILAYGAQTIVNTGLVAGSVGIDLVGVDGHGATIRNAGTIDAGSTSVRGGEFADTVINAGKLYGDLLLGAGDDLFVMRAAGELTGKARGGLGNDTYVLAKSGIQVTEMSGQGWDTVRSSVDHGLADNVEVLRLLGKGGLTGVGNGGDNQLFGNKGDNGLYGSFGSDVLDGGKGDDVLAGGAGDPDEFHFSRGTGTDSIVDFEPGSDEVHFHALKGATDFADMMAHHVTEVDGDVWITYGKDVIVLADTVKSELQGSDFIFL